MFDISYVSSGVAGYCSGLGVLRVLLALSYYYNIFLRFRSLHAKISAKEIRISGGSSGRHCILRIRFMSQVR